jgi:hypothetical protein
MGRPKQKKSTFDRAKYSREYMRKRRAVDPKYGQPKTWRRTPAYCPACNRQREWRDAVATVADGKPVLCCPECGASLMALCKQ